MPQNKQSHRHPLCSVMSHVVLFAYPIKLNIWIKNTVTKILPKKLYCEFDSIDQIAMKIFLSQVEFELVNSGFLTAALPQCTNLYIIL